MNPVCRRFGPFTIDVAERLLLRDGHVVSLAPKAFDLLAALVDRPGRLLTKDELIKELWPDAFVEEANLAYNVFALRKALGGTPDGPRYIETVPKRGYRFVAAVTPADGPSLTASHEHPESDSVPREMVEPEAADGRVETAQPVVQSLMPVQGFRNG